MGEEKIEVRLGVGDMPLRCGFVDYAVWLEKKLKDAGIPFGVGGVLQHGYLQRFDDPKDFGAVVYVWTPDK